MIEVKDILSKFDIKEIGLHLSNYIDLFIKPLSVWKKTITNRSSSYNLTILHTFYYSIFILIFVNQSKTLISQYIILEVIITLIPFIFFLFPFKLFTKVFKKNIKWNRMFRLFIILKLQFLPLIILLIIFARWLDNEIPYIIIENLIGILWLFFISLLPLLLKIKSWQKVVWVLTNYIFSILFLFVLFFFLKNTNDFNLIEKISPKTPDQEYQMYHMKSSYSIYSIQDGYYLKIINNNTNIIESQFVSTDLLIWYLSIFDKTESNNYTIHPDSVNLNLEKFYSLKKIVNDEFQKDLELTGRLKDSSIFKSNKKYFASLYEYLKNIKNHLLIKTYSTL